MIPQSKKTGSKAISKIKNKDIQQAAMIYFSKDSNITPAEKEKAFTLMFNVTRPRLISFLNKKVNQLLESKAQNLLFVNTEDKLDCLDDIVLDSFTKVVAEQNESLYAQEKASFVTWFYTCTYNNMITTLKRKSRLIKVSCLNIKNTESDQGIDHSDIIDRISASESSPNIFDSVEDMEGRLEYVDFVETIFQYMNKNFSKRDNDIFLRKVVYNETLEEVGKQFNLTAQGIRAIVTDKIIKNLRKEFAEEISLLKL